MLFFKNVFTPGTFFLFLYFTCNSFVFCEKYHFETTSETKAGIILDLLPTVTASAAIVFTF